ncbi:MAG: DUF2194 domain-containing protein [Lachnospiraceae bacterium]|nr:DUF2194 domain-containing protein [Lachnospiraceae bacterium]
MEKKSKEKLRVQKFKYYTITAGIIIFFLVFQLISNLTYLLLEQGSTDIKHKNIPVQKYFQEVKALEDNRTTEEKAEYRIFGDEDDAGVLMLCGELNNLNFTYEVSENVTFKEGKTEAIFLNKNNYSQEEQDSIDRYIEEGTHVIWSRLPSAKILQSEWGRKQLGILEDKGKKNYKGIRIISNFLASDLLEFENIEIELEDVSLVQGSKVFAYSLKGYKADETLGKNETLPPLIWRHMMGDSEIFVVNSNLMSTKVAPGICVSILAKIKGSMIYPVINGNCIFFMNYPYTDNFKSEELDKRYSRDAMGVERDLLFPGISNLCSKYNVIPTYYTEDYEAFKQNNNDSTLDYFKKQIVREGTALGKVLNGDCVYFDEQKPDTSIPTALKEWGSSFTFVDAQKERLNIPVVKEQPKLTHTDIITICSAVTSLGFVSTRVNMENVLHPQDDSDDWVKYYDDMNTTTGIVQNMYPYVDPLNVVDATNRILVFRNLQPQITYKTNEDKKSGQIIVEPKSFSGVAYYILRLEVPFKSIEGGTAEQIIDNTYLIEETANKLIIEY